MKQYFISKDASIKDALKQMDRCASKILFAVEENEVIAGSVSDGDIRRAILKGLFLDSSIETVMNRKPICFKQDYQLEDVKKILLEKKFEAIPIIDNLGRIKKILFWSNVFQKKEREYEQINLPVVIMAGGKGTRLDPFTRILPKPLIPIDNKAIIEVIMDEYAKFGMKKFYISINYKGNIIKAYFEEQKSDYNFEFIEENTPLGTAGALKLLEKKVNTPFFVSNCDIIIKENYSRIYDFHKKNDYVLTLVGSMQHHIIPYGVCEIESGGTLKKINEKPEYDFLINTGMYLLNPEVFRFIPNNKFYNITDLISVLKKNNYEVGVYPVSEKSWIDIGQWEKYKSNLNKLL